ncbi:MAG: PorT family protein, partial [Bacteroidales bacterium]|nr:PorT family protein [Bacteroidales bacterium]
RFSYESMNITVDEKGDTTEIIFGNHKIIVDDDGNVVYKKHKKKPKFNGHWAGFDLGVNGFLTPDNTMNYGPEFEYLDLNMTKSIKVGINIFEQNLNLCRNQKWGLVTGLGWEINNYRFDDNVSLVPDSSSIKGYFNDGISMKKSKLVVNYVEVPLLLEFQTNAKRKVNSFHIAAGMVFGLRFASHTKQYYNETNKEYTWLEVDPETGNKVPVPGIKFQSPGTKKSKVRDDFHLNPFKADATVRIGWGWVNLFGTYSITTLFKEGKGPELYPFSVGLTLVGL